MGDFPSHQRIPDLGPQHMETPPRDTWREDNRLQVNGFPSLRQGLPWASPLDLGLTC